jgi:ATP-dependent helicase/nuclease subunit A
MAATPFTIYRSSAGSGKTRTLAKEYIRLALQFNSGYFRHILAVTFTNKATQEMKDRILKYLDEFARGRDNDLSGELMEELKMDENTFRERSHRVQLEILHNYNQFSISTIDAFFQRVIRSFTREAGLMGDYRLEVEQDDVLDEVINNLIDELGNNKELTAWVVDFARENLANDLPWDVRQNLKDFAKELLKEEFKRVEDDLVNSSSNPEFFTNFRKELGRRKHQFIGFVRKKSGEVIHSFRQAGLTVNDFKYGKSGSVYGWFNKLANLSSVADFAEPGKRAFTEFQTVSGWLGKNPVKNKVITTIAEAGALETLYEIIDYHKRNLRQSLSAEIVFNNFYAFGLTADISRKLKEFKDTNNLLLLADAPKFLNSIIDKSDTPFVYEKLGSFYKNFLIDEFQDTSGLQWDNLRPLIVNSLDQGNRSLVVGDVKQAIYRWRGGNLKLLQLEIENQIGKERTAIKNLATNFRSARNLVSFNNALFETAAQVVANEVEAEISTEAFRDVTQQVHKTDEGFVRIQFINNTNDDKWEATALDEMCNTLEILQQAGASLQDIAILVRRNEEGQRIVAHLLKYKNSPSAKPGMRYEVISNESLRIDGAASVNLLLAAMRYLDNPDDTISRAQLSYEFSRVNGTDRSLTEILMVTSHPLFESYLPESFTHARQGLRKLPLFELTETLIHIFKLDKQTGELPYLQAFEDIVLNFASRERNDIHEFLSWWEENRHTEKTSLKSSGNPNAVQILTVHKAKGLQFKYVIVPFCSWDLDHWKPPTLWVKSDEAVFKQVGTLPVRYGSALKESFFSTYYHTERASCYLDNLNLLYVAFTRAESGLFVTAPAPGKSKKEDELSKNAGGLLYLAIQSNSTLKGNWNSSANCWQTGTLTSTQTSQPVAAESSLTLHTYPTSLWRDKLVVRQAGPLFFGTDAEGRVSGIQYGIHIHSILSAVSYADELDQGIARLRDAGLLRYNEEVDVRNQLTSLFQNPLVATWFDRKWEVRTEVPLLIPGEGERRIDRLMTQGNKAVVVDFKTGKPLKADHKQVMEYMDILRRMNFTDVEGYLLYTASAEVVEVKTGRVKSGRKRNSSQLELGLE